MKVRIDISRYYKVHQKAPRGKGAWFFETRDGKGASFNGSYAQAKALAMDWGRTCGESVLYLLG